ncbi:MAG: hypothetical protein IKE46_11095 [Selenomonadaceae bacterium]|nr:hypothetical protein [Selenomonadaceae bacterium]
MIYEANKYFEFFVIDEGYYPEINESSIKDPKNKWQSTFPHGDIVELLKLLERALSRSDRKSLWLEGSYGTGKSRIIWMMQSLLSCPETDFDAYFDEYDNLRGEVDLRERLRAIRNGKIVTAYRYATGDVTSTQKLIFAVFDSLTDALKKSGCKFDGAKTLRGRIVNWLESDTANLELFRAKIRKPEYMMSATLANRSAEEILERLKNPQSEVSQLVEDILKLGEREGIRAFNIDMSDLIDWITEVTEKNNLKALVLFWDEFSKFFGNNRNNLDEFQRLAELTNIKPFYLVIATHESQSLVGEGDQAFRTVSDRFTHKNITMPDNIAFELIGHALKVKDAAKNDWKFISAALKERTAEPRKVIMDFAKIRDEKILTDILPIHPIAAILLKNLAGYFASNQRSVFNFIKNSDPNIKAFQEFIATKSPENGDLLTIDYLWNFFYESGTDEHGGNVGRMNLKPSIRTILDSYGLNKNNLNLDEQVVLKTILLLQAIDQEAGGQVDIFRPTEKNLELSFTGVASMENGRAVTIANDLVRKEILFIKPDKKGKTFAALALGGDFAEIERLKKTIKENARTAALVESANLLDVITRTPSQKVRYDLRAVTAENFTLTINRITNEKEDYRIKAVVCFARNEDEQNKLYNLIGGAIKNPRYLRLVIIDASSNLINRELFNRWVENSASEQYWRSKDSSLANKMKSNAEDCLKEWSNSFVNGSFVYYPAVRDEREERKGISCQNADGLTEEFKDNVRRLFPYSFDDANITDTLFQATNLPKLSEAGILREEFRMLKANQIKIVLGDVWQMSGKYWEVYPDLNISRLKIELDALIKTEIDKNVRISFDDIFNFLLERGFMPLNIYAFLTGFLLKEYAADPYRYSGGIDGNMGGAMTTQKLSECVGESIKQAFNPATKSYRQKFLEIMSANQRQFMEFASKIFDVAEDVSVEQSAQKLRLKLKNLGYPLWCYVEAATDEYKNFLYLLAEIANSKQAVSVSALAERAGQFLINNPVAFHDLKNFFTVDTGREIFTDFLRHFEDGIIFELAEKIGISDAVAECQRRVTSDDKIWLHDKETAEDDLRKMIVDYKIVVESKNFGINGKSLNSCAQAWKDFCRCNIKIPCDVIAESFPAIKDFLAVLKEIVVRGDIPQSKREFFLGQLIDNAEIIRAVMKEPLKILRDKFSYQLNDLSEQEINEIYPSLPYSSFTDSRGQYHKILNDKAQEILKGQLKNELRKLWREIAGNKSPREWSKIHRTPILAMVPKSEVSDAKKVFDTVMATAPDKNAVNFAIAYLKNHPSYFADIKSERQIEEAFRDAVIDDKQVLFNDNDEVRNELEAKFRGDAYQWYPNMRVKELVDEISRNKYYSGGAYDKITAQVMQMSPEKAKTLLIDLLDKNYEVGLKILREGLERGKFER